MSAQYQGHTGLTPVNQSNMEFLGNEDAVNQTNMAFAGGKYMIGRSRNEVTANIEQHKSEPSRGGDNIRAQHAAFNDMRKTLQGEGRRGQQHITYDNGQYMQGTHVMGQPPIQQMEPVNPDVRECLDMPIHVDLDVRERHDRMVRERLDRLANENDSIHVSLERNRQQDAEQNLELSAGTSHGRGQLSVSSRFSSDSDQQNKRDLNYSEVQATYLQDVDLGMHDRIENSPDQKSNATKIHSLNPGSSQPNPKTNQPINPGTIQPTGGITQPISPQSSQHMARIIQPISPGSSQPMAKTNQALHPGTIQPTGGITQPINPVSSQTMMRIKQSLHPNSSQPTDKITQSLNPDSAQPTTKISQSLSPVGSSSLSPVGCSSLSPVGGSSLSPVGGSSLSRLGGSSLSPVGGSSLSRVGGSSLSPGGGSSLNPVGGSSLNPVGGSSLNPVGGSSLSPVGGSSQPAGISQSLHPSSAQSTTRITQSLSPGSTRKIHYPSGSSCEIPVNSSQERSEGGVSSPELKSTIDWFKLSRNSSFFRSPQSSNEDDEKRFSEYFKNLVPEPKAPVVVPCVCGLCCAKFMDLNEIMMHMASHKETIYTCGLCFESFRLPEQFVKHMENHLAQNWRGKRLYSGRPKLPGFPDPPRKSDSASNSPKHMKADILGKDAEATIRDVISGLSESLKNGKTESLLTLPDGIAVNDVNSFSSPVPARPHLSFTCHDCSKVFSAKHKLVEHSRKHTGERPYTCNLCTKSFTRSYHLSRHKLTHKPDRPFSCGVCSKTFVFNYKLTEHLKIHQDIKPFSCTDCSKTFARNDHLNRHRQTHGDLRFKCHSCPKTFASEDRLETHIKHCHDIAPPPCSLCGLCFQTKADEMAHKCSTLKIASDDRPETHIKHCHDLPIAPPPCSQCGLCFQTIANKMAHKCSPIKIASDDRPETHIKHCHELTPPQCSQCGLRFQTKSDEMAHKCSTLQIA